MTMFGMPDINAKDPKQREYNRAIARRYYGWVDPAEQSLESASLESLLKKREQITAEVKAAREGGDVSDSGPYQAAREQLSMINARIGSMSGGFSKMKPLPKMTPTQSKEAAERYRKELAAVGIDIKTLGKPPAPATNQATETRRVLTGQRNAALVDEATANQAKQWGLNAFKVPHGVFTGSVAQSKAYIIYLPGRADRAKRVVEVLNRYPIGKRGPGYLAELGNALGTPPSETNEYIKKVYGEKKSGSPAWLGLLGVAFFIIFLTRRQTVASGVVSPPDQYIPEIYRLRGLDEKN